MSIVQKPSAVERLRRSIDRRVRDGDAAWAEGSTDDCAELKLELLLLREEIARLKADRHRPVDLGTVIEYLRLIGQPPANPETVDDAWSMLSDCHVVREALAQASIEIEAAIAALQAQLRDGPHPLDDPPPQSVDLVAPASTGGAPGGPEGLVSAA